MFFKKFMVSKSKFILVQTFFKSMQMSFQDHSWENMYYEKITHIFQKFYIK